jgi:SAM-dependent methyltransferase
VAWLRRWSVLDKLLGAPVRRAPSVAVPEIRWFDNREDYAAYVEPTRPARRAQETAIGAQPVWGGYCVFCASPTRFTVSAGAMLGNNVNLREGLVCETCHLGNRLRLIYKAVEDSSGGQAALRAKSVYIAERISLFYERLIGRVGELTGSEYLDPGYEPGSTHLTAGRRVRHEDLCRLSFPSESFDLVLHADVLEHVPDYVSALREMCRVTRRGGAMFFSVPFLHDPYEHEVRATISATGEIVHHLPAAYHGNPLSERGSLAFRTYGWALLDDLKAAGFTSAEAGVLTDLSLGFASSNSPAGDYMEPVIFRARRTA